MASGSRASAFGDFQTATAQKAEGDYVALWIDSEDPSRDLEETWTHLKHRDGWTRPAESTDDQVLFMTTCMETLSVADHAALQEHYGPRLQVSALPPVVNLEERDRPDVQRKLAHATRNCTNYYVKGVRSFRFLAELSPDTLASKLPSFARTRRILDGKL